MEGMPWHVVFSHLVTDWLDGVDESTYEQVFAAVKVLGEEGPSLGRPLVDRVNSSRFHNMKELRPGSVGRTEVRMLFMFDPERKAIILIVGDKSGQWDRWYRKAIPQAEELYEAHLRGEEI
jgi:hypothetical protein